MTGKAPLSPTLSIVPQVWLPGSRRVVQERVSLRVPRSLERDTPETELWAALLQPPQTSPFFSHTAHALPSPSTGTCARAPDAVPASRWLPITAFCSSLVTETTVLRLWPRPLALLPAFRALRPIPSVRVLAGSRLPVPALQKARPL